MWKYLVVKMVLVCAVYGKDACVQELIQHSEKNAQYIYIIVQLTNQPHTSFFSICACVYIVHATGAVGGH